ncbi:MAG TPA: hypothetical protein VKZ97_02700 [Flavobacteriaceae bacterium]|nr:hypothetical protein [Flavobacteriaceae bacterium]
MKTFKNIFGLLLCTALVTLSACSKDDDGDGGSNLDGVPSGEIVSAEFRNVVLTGYTDLESGEGTQRWWTHVISDFNFNSEDCGDDFSYEDTGYYAWYPDGSYYVKTSLNGSPTQVGEWEWANSSKTRIYIYNYSNGSEGEMTVTYLNDNNVVYGSYQSGGGCSLTTYEQFNNPIE